MSSDLVQVSTATSIAQNPLAGGFSFGGNSRLFRLKPAQLELQQKTSRAEGSQEGKFRVTDTGEHFESLHVVMIFEPQEKRTYYASKNEFGVPPLCYSLDAIVPSDKAAQPQSLRCATCRQQDWTTWKKTKRQDDLPKCKNRFDITFVDRASKVPYRLSVRGKSISKMGGAMQTIARLAELYKAQKGVYPNLYDFSFKIGVTRKVDNSGVYYEMNFSDIMLINEEDRAGFGELFQQFVAARQSGDLSEEANQENGSVDSAMTEGAATTTAEPQYVQPSTTSDNVVTI